MNQHCSKHVLDVIPPRFCNYCHNYIGQANLLFCAEYMVVSNGLDVLLYSFFASLVIQGFKDVLSKYKANEERLVLELETAKKECHKKAEEIAQLESSRKENEARIAVLEKEKLHQECRIEELEEAVLAQRQELGQKQREIENMKQKCKSTATGGQTAHNCLMISGFKLIVCSLALISSTEIYFTNNYCVHNDPYQ